MGIGIVVGNTFTLGRIVGVSAAAKAMENGVALERKIAVLTENQAFYYVYRF